MKRAVFPILAILASCGPTSPLAVRKVAAGSDVTTLLPSRPTKGALFSYYDPRNRSPRKGNWTASLDLSGVSWNDPCTATLISPSHVVMAAHFMRGGDKPFIFHDRDGKPHERFLAGAKILGQVGDIGVGKLNRPLPANVKYYRMATPALATVGRRVIVTDQTMTVSVHRIGAVYGPGIGFEYDPSLDPVYRRNLIVGDSGNPTFLLENGELLLLETHTTGGPGAGPFYGDPGVQAAIRGAIEELGE